MKQDIQNLIPRATTSTLRGWLLLLMLVAGAWGSGLAQNRPVTSTLQLTPPYSVYLADYARPGSEQMLVYLLLRDLSELQYDARLRLTIEGSGIRLQTDPNYQPPPLTLEGGSPTIVSGEDLAPYLDSRNLLFSGITQAEYEQRRALPEGFYQFSVEVLDYRRADRSLSRPATFMAWFTLNEPPRITAPLCGSTLPLQEPTNILFQWMDGGNVLPGAALATEYELTLVEVFPADRPVEDAIRSSIPLLQTTTTETSYLYGLTDAALIPGQKYALRVRALDTEGRGIFKNDGYSQVCSFTYEDGLIITPPDGIQVYAENARKALVNWHLSIDPDAYRVEYRRKADSDDEELAWFSIETTQEQVVLRDLEPETTYEVRVASLFSSYVSRYSLVQTFTTPEVIVAACGAVPASPITASTVPLPTAMAGQYWQVGDFEMQVREVRGGDGVFTGWGVMSVPYLSVQIPVKFDQVWVDEDYNVVRGEVIALSEGLKGFQQRWQDKHPEEEVSEEDESSPVAEGEEGAENGPGDEVEVSTVSVEGEVVRVYVNEQGQVVAVDSQGNQEVVAEQVPEEGEALAVQDSQGNSFTVDSSGGVSNGGGGNTSESDSDTQAASGDALMLSILNDLEEAVNAWLEVYGKGPLSADEMQVLADLPAGFPADADLLAHISDHTFDQARANTETFRQAITQQNTQARQLLQKDLAALSDAELAQVKEAIALQTTSLGLIGDVEDFLNGFGFNGSCLSSGLQRGKSVFWQRIGGGYSVEKAVVLGTNATTVGVLSCLTSRENCPGSGYWGQFSCGAASALVDEIDLNGMVDAGTAAAKAYLKNHIDCILEGSGVVVVLRSDNASEVLRNLNRCFLGVDLSVEEMQQVYTSVQKYVAEHYDDSYDQGKATVFVLSIASPFTKVNKATKLNMLTKLEQLGNKVDDGLSALKRAVDAEDMDEVQLAIGAAARSSIDNLSAKSKQLLDSWPTDAYNQFYDEVVSTEVWDEAFKNAADQDGLVQAWKIIENNPILRKKSKNLENISKWLDEGIEPQKLTDGIAKSKSKQNLIDELGTAQSKLHAQVLIKNYDNIPGVVKGRYTPNGSTLADKVDLPSGWTDDFDLPENQIRNFTDKVEPLELKPGDKIYRVSHSNGASGPYWTRTKPKQIDDVVGGTAVLPEWNNFQYLHEYTIPDGVTIKSWKGKTASQPVSYKADGTPLPSNYHLPGGDEQLFISFIGKQDPNFNIAVKSVEITW